MLRGQKNSRFITIEVHSHPMVFISVYGILKKYPDIKLVEEADTAETASQNLKTIN
jgi:prephenate dehydratase